MNFYKDRTSFDDKKVKFYKKTITKCIYYNKVSSYK